MLEFYGARKEWINDFNRYYPEGVEFKQIITDKFLSIVTVHFIYNYCNLSSEEKQQYNQYCNIDESCKYYLNSVDLKNSQYIFNSKNISNSKYIYNSEDIINSANIAYSNNISYSSDILNSSEVMYSASVIKSEKITSSKQIIASKNINFSNFICYSDIVNDSQFIYNSFQTYFSLFCGALSNCNHCIFSFNLKDSNYMVFNKPVAVEDYEILENKLVTFLLQQMELAIITVKNNIDFHFDSSPVEMFRILPEDFFKIMKQAPNYNKEDAFLLLGREI